MLISVEHLQEKVTVEVTKVHEVISTAYQHKSLEFLFVMS